VARWKTGHPSNRGPFMGKNEENEDARIATSPRGFKKSEDRGFIKPKIEDLKTLRI